MNGDERDLLATITQILEQNSQDQHQLAREQRALRDAATQLRTGRSAAVVEAQLAEVGVSLRRLAAR